MLKLGLPARNQLDPIDDVRQVQQPDHSCGSPTVPLVSPGLTFFVDTAAASTAGVLKALVETEGLSPALRCRDWQIETQTPEAALVITELVVNAVQHAGSRPHRRAAACDSNADCNGAAGTGRASDPEAGRWHRRRPTAPARSRGCKAVSIVTLGSGCGDRSTTMPVSGPGRGPGG
jgi:hypothetical protein